MATTSKGWQGGYGLSSGLNIQYQQAQLDLEVAKGELLYHQNKFQ